MFLRRKRQELIALRKHPGDPEPDWCSPGSIEQELDMCEKGSLRGDEISHAHGKEAPEETDEPVDLDKVINENWEADPAAKDPDQERD